MGLRLSECKKGQKVKILAIHGNDDFASRLMQSGFLPEVELTVKRLAPFFKDPILISIHGRDMALTKDEAKRVELYE